MSYQTLSEEGVSPSVNATDTRSAHLDSVRPATPPATSPIPSDSPQSPLPEVEINEAEEVASFKLDHAISREGLYRYTRRILIVTTLLALSMAGCWIGYDLAHEDDAECTRHKSRFGCGMTDVSMAMLLLGLVFTGLFSYFTFVYTIAFIDKRAASRSIESKGAVFWILKGRQWIRFVDKYYGPSANESNGARCYCCRRRLYRRLRARPFGRILLSTAGFCLEGDDLIPVSSCAATLLFVRLYRSSMDRVLEIQLRPSGRHTGEFSRFAVVPADVSDAQARRVYHLLAAECERFVACNVTL